MERRSEAVAIAAAVAQRRARPDRTVQAMARPD